MIKDEEMDMIINELYMARIRINATKHRLVGRLYDAGYDIDEDDQRLVALKQLETDIDNVGALIMELNTK